MTAEREMTLEQVRTRLRDLVRQAPDEMDSVIVPIRDLIGFAHAIDAHLSRAAEPVAKVRIFEWDGEWGWELYNDKPFQNLPVGNYELYLHPPEPARDAEPVGEIVEMGGNGRAGGYRAVRWREGEPPQVGTKFYAHPPEPAKDAARYRWLRDRMYRFEIEAGVLDSKAFAQRPRIGYGREVDSAIDNAMTKENGDG